MKQCPFCAVGSLRHRTGEIQGKIAYHSPNDSIQLTLPQTANKPRLYSPRQRKESTFEFQLRELHSSGQHEMTDFQSKDRKDLLLQLNGITTHNTDYTDGESNTVRTSHLKLRPGETVD